MKSPRNYKYKERHGGAAAYRNISRDSSPEGYQKYLAWKTVENNLKSGKITKQSCELCYRTDTHAHHFDYSKPLEIIWLCPLHHKELHKELKKLKTKNNKKSLDNH